METLITLMGPRACGKSTVALLLSDLLGSPWDVRDIDMLCRIRLGKRSQSPLMIHADDYLAESRELVFESLAAPHGLLALGGGALINSKYPAGDLDLMIEIKKHGPLILLLPTKSDGRNRRILYQRELERSYELPRNILQRLKDTCHSQYDNRIDFMRENADFTVHGTNPSKSAARIIKQYSLLKSVS